MLEYKLGSIVIMKKPHPCGTNEWEITRLGADIKIKCLNCGRTIMLPRIEFNKKLKKRLNLNFSRDELLALAKKKKNKIYGPVFAIFIIIIIISLLSLIFSILNIEGYKNVIANNTLESQLITVRNIISIDGIKYLFENIVNNFMNL